ncbi:MAG: glycosyltransferase family 4 protein [bacterium]
MAFRKAARMVIGTKNCLNNIPKKYHSKCRFIPVAGIDCGLFPQKTNIANKIITILYAGTITDVKGLDLLIRALNKIKKFCDFKLNIAGSPTKSADDKAFYTYCVDLTEKLSLSQQVSFLGQISKQEMLKQMRNCDIFCLPSLWEAFGVVIIEAMACSKPVIVVHSGGPAEIVNEEFGIKIPCLRLDQFIDSLGQALLDLIKNPEKRMQMGSKARECAEKDFSWTVLGRKMQVVYEECV